MTTETTGDSGTPTIPVDPFAVAYNTSACGSLSVATTVHSTDRDQPSALPLGTIVKGLIDPDSTTSDIHYWAVGEIPPGAYHLVLDEQRADYPASATNLGLDITALDENGVDQDELITGNELDSRFRSHALFTVTDPTYLALEVAPVYGDETYVLGVFQASSPVPTPYFTDCPDVEVLALGTPVSYEVSVPTDPNAEHWAVFDAEPGTYRVQIDGDRKDGLNSNIMFETRHYDRFASEDRQEEVLDVNTIDSTSRTEGVVEVSQATRLYLETFNKSGALEMEILIEAK